MKKIFTLSLAVIFGAGAMAQTLPSDISKTAGIPKHTDQKFYIKDGKVTKSLDARPNQKSGSDVTDYLDYFDVELDGYGLGDDGQVPRFYDVMEDSSRMLVGTAFTHIFDELTFDVFGFDSIGRTDNVDYIIIDSVLFNFGHSNNSGQDNMLALTLKTLPLGGGPSQTGSIIWSDTTYSNDFTTGLAINFLPLFSAPVAETLSYNNRGVYFELAFDGEYPTDSAAYLFNFWDSKITCSSQPTFTGRLESWTLREAGLTDSRVYFMDNYWSALVGGQPNQVYNSFQAFLDCNSNGSYDRNTNEASSQQNLAMGIWYTYGGDFFGISDYNNDLSDLSQNYPNPFSSTTTIDYTLVNSTNVAIEVFDITGKSVTYINEGLKSAGSYQVSIDATSLNDGIYYYSFKTDAGQVTKKMVVKH